MQLCIILYSTFSVFIIYVCYGNVNHRFRKLCRCCDYLLRFNFTVLLCQKEKIIDVCIYADFYRHYAYFVQNAFFLLEYKNKKPLMFLPLLYIACIKDAVCNVDSMLLEK